MRSRCHLGCRRAGGVGSRFPVPPTAAEGKEQGGGVRIAVGLRLDPVAVGLQELTLEVQQRQMTDPAHFVLAPGNFVADPGMVGGLDSGFEFPSVGFQGTEGIGNFLQSLEHGLSIAGGGGLIGRNGRAFPSPQFPPRERRAA